MKYIGKATILAALMAVSFSAMAFAADTTAVTTTPVQEQATTTAPASLYQRLQGKTLDLNYTSGDHYHVTVLSDTQLRWKSLGVSDGGPAEETEAYTVKQVGQDVYFVSWMEQSGMTVSEVIDLGQGKVYATITWGDTTKANGRDSVTIEGTATVLP